MVFPAQPERHAESYEEFSELLLVLPHDPFAILSPPGFIAS